MRGLVAQGVDVFSSVADVKLGFGTLLLRSSETLMLTLLVVALALFVATSTVITASTSSFSLLERLRLLGVMPLATSAALAALLSERLELGVTPLAVVLTARLRLLGVMPLTVVLFSLLGVAVLSSRDEFTERHH